MAQSISDVFARAKAGKTDGGRRARFVGGEASAEAMALPTRPARSGGDSRRAAYRPAETLALRRDVADAFAAAMLRDARREKGGGPSLLLDAARTAEVRREFELAFERLREFERKGGEWNWESAMLRRRVLRSLEADDALRRALREAPQLDGAPGWARVYAGLEEAMVAWKEGDDPEVVRRRCRRAIRGKGDQPGPDRFAALWAMQLQCDAALEANRRQDAFEAIEEALELPELVVEVRQALEARRAVWMHVYGHPQRSRELLDDLARRGTLPGDLDDLLVSLCFEAGDKTRAFTLLRSTAGDQCRLEDHAVPLVMLHDTAADNPATGRDVLREATMESDDWTLLRLRNNFLDADDDNRRGRATELIDVLNRRLEGPLSVDERVNALTRLGRLYEVEAGLEEAAAEVYREALSYDPQHVPALRALGRLYTRRGNWGALAELYEREIATLSHRPAGWRRHFQLAELYEHRLDRDERALENYLIVLEEKPNYLPALKSSARILGRLGRWTRLADLFLRMVESAPSRRQKLYLLDKVAEVAEVHLENYEVAIGAWKETLELDPENPRAYTTLGRLFARTQRWEELIDLNVAEMELIDDPEEVAAVWLRNAEIAEQHLENVELAEQYYRKTLEVIPDYLPALEALGRIYLRGGRWAEIVEMTGRELQEANDLEKTNRQLGALAEILETKLDRRGDAIAIYERLWAEDSSDGYVFSALARLYRAEGRWNELEELLNTRLQYNPGVEEFAALHGELAILAEWRTNRPQRAYHCYVAALQCDSTNRHWLNGVARTWPEADVEPGDVADELEDLLMHVTGEKIRDRYFAIVARLRERAETGPEASRAYRAHGSAQSLENQIVLRLAMASAGERRQLKAAREAVPHHRWQELLTLDRREMTGSMVERLSDQSERLPEAAQKWIGGELPPVVAGHVGRVEPLSADLVAILEGEDLHAEQTAEVDDVRRMRLRALQARRFGDHEAYLRWTRAEMGGVSRETGARRHLELARYATQHQLVEEAELYRKACSAVFPELEIDSGEALEDDPVEAIDVEDAHLDRLYEALRTTERWELLRRCLEAQVARADTDREERLELFEELATLLQERLFDYEGARDALVHCWQISEEPRFLRRIVTLAREHGKEEDALRFQQKHFEKLSMSSEATASQRVQSGIWLAELLLANDEPDDRAAAIDCLEHLIESYDEVTGLRRAQRMLARAHAEAGNGRRAAELFEDVLHFQMRADELEDWRRLVEVYRAGLGDVDRAYTHQWRIVRAFPGSKPDLDVLIDLAAEAMETEDCIEQLKTLANATADDNKARLLARAAEAADEELGHAEDAYNLFDRVVELCAEDHDERVYYERRRAVCLARMAGREPKAMEAFRELIRREPFEPANYRGMETLFERANAHDRLRVARQTLKMLGCKVENADPTGKVHPTRTLDAGVVEHQLMPDELGEGLFDLLHTAMPLVEKVFSEELPQRKALDGYRIKSGAEEPFYDDLKAALIAFGVLRFKFYLGDSGPEHPMVFCGKTPTIWINSELLEQLSGAERRFIAGYCAAIVWSGLPALMAVDGRRVWHLLEGVLYRETGQGFTERLDVASQEMANQVSSPFDMKRRRDIVAAIEACEVENLVDCHCEAWGRRLEGFAARAGLLLSGDLAAAGSGLLRLSGWNLPVGEEATQRRLKNHEVVQDLIELAHSDEYLELRYQAGLAGRPSRLGI